MSRKIKVSFENKLRAGIKEACTKHSIFSASLRKNQVFVSVYIVVGKVYNRGKSIETGVCYEVFEIGDSGGWVFLYP